MKLTLKMSAKILAMTSNYLTNSKCYDDSNKLFVGFKHKMYSYLVDDSSDQKSKRHKQTHNQTRCGNNKS